MKHPFAMLLILAISAALTFSACGNSNPTQPAAQATTTDTFSGTLVQQASAVYQFKVSQAGNVTSTLVSVGPLATLAIGFGVGVWDGTTCTLATEDDNARQGDVLTGTAQPGNFCVKAFDVGNIVDPVTFTVQVVHP